jgi:hypothetical protein
MALAHSLTQPIKLLSRLLAAGMAVSTAGLAVPAFSRDAPAGARAITCTNPASGASWQIRIDYDKSTVDSNPARIGDAQITWRDAKDGGNYSLDLNSGSLTVIIASSTGGYFLHDHCGAGNSG